MSYARWGHSSHVYVYLDVGGFLNCCGCTEEKDFHAHTTAEMLVHLDGHMEKGHAVPAHCLEGLRADQEENDAFMRGESDG